MLTSFQPISLRLKFLFCFPSSPILPPLPYSHQEKSLGFLTNTTQSIRTSCWVLRFQAGSSKDQIHSKTGAPFGKHTALGFGMHSCEQTMSQPWGEGQWCGIKQDLCTEDTTAFTAELNQMEKELSSGVCAIINLFQVSFPSFNQAFSQAVMPYSP